MHHLSGTLPLLNWSCYFQNQLRPYLHILNDNSSGWPWTFPVLTLKVLWIPVSSSVLGKLGCQGCLTSPVPAAATRMNTLFTPVSAYSPANINPTLKAQFRYHLSIPENFSYSSSLSQEPSDSQSMVSFIETFVVSFYFVNPWKQGLLSYLSHNWTSGSWIWGIDSSSGAACCSSEE